MMGLNVVFWLAAASLWSFVAWRQWSWVQRERHIEQALALVDGDR